MATSGSTSPFRLTTHLLSLHKPQFTRATQSPFLLHAASGNLSKPVISHWLANDRFYMLGYIRLTGELLRIIKLPAAPTPSKSLGSTELQLVDWLIDALVNIRREEKFFIEVAEKFGLEIDCIVGEDGNVVEEKKIEGLRRFEALFDSLTEGSTKPTNPDLPWLEGAVLFWATEKVYHEAWLWAKGRAEGEEQKDPSKDADGGAMRKEFIPNWTNEDFGEFVGKLEKIVDQGVGEFLAKNEEKKPQVVERAEGIWERLLDAEEAFWPEV